MVKSVVLEIFFIFRQISVTLWFSGVQYVILICLSDPKFVVCPSCWIEVFPKGEKMIVRGVQENSTGTTSSQGYVSYFDHSTISTFSGFLPFTVNLH